MITDANGDELVYWPITGLIEGQDSEVLEFIVPIPTTRASLYAKYSDKIQTWVKKVGDSTYVDISVTPYDVSALSGDIHFLGFVRALTPISGLERIPVSITCGTSSAAGWST